MEERMCENSVLRNGGASTARGREETRRLGSPGKSMVGGLAVFMVQSGWWTRSEVKNIGGNVLERWMGGRAGF